MKRDKKKNNSLQKTTEKLKIEQHEPLLKWGTQMLQKVISSCCNSGTRREFSYSLNTTKK
jgi:hypothetical protein